MPFTFSVAEYADMICVCCFCDGNSVHAVAEYQWRFPNCRIPTWRVFTQVYQTLWDTGTLPGVRIAAGRNVNEGIDEEEGIVQMVQSSPRVNTRRIARRLHIPHTRVWRTLDVLDDQFWTISWLVLSSWKVVLQERRTSDFYRRNCSDFCRMCLWINEVVCISNMTELLLIFHVKLEISWTIVSLGDGSDVAVPTIGQPASQT